MSDIAPPCGFYATTVKRWVDVALSIVLVPLLLPLLACVWIAVRIALGSPCLHVDERAGSHGRPFRLFKFRSMSDARGEDGHLLPDAARLDAFGRFLRRTSLDELPQLFNVLFGDMSLVGPRPLPLRYVPRYSSRQRSRLLVRPGLTGWAQIHGRNDLDWPARLELDVRYVEMLSRWYAPLVDLCILTATVFHVAWHAFSGRGVAARGSATMTEFFP